MLPAVERWKGEERTVEFMVEKVEGWMLKKLKSPLNIMLGGEVSLDAKLMIVLRACVFP